MRFFHGRFCMHVSTCATRVETSARNVGAERESSNAKDSHGLESFRRQVKLIPSRCDEKHSPASTARSPRGKDNSYGSTKIRVLRDGRRQVGLVGCDETQAWRQIDYGICTPRPLWGGVGRVRHRSRARCGHCTKWRSTRLRVDRFLRETGHADVAATSP